MKFNVIIKETLEREIVVTANSKEEAEEKVRKRYEDAEVILDWEDFVAVEFTTTEIK